MKNQILRCNVGIDVSKAEFSACILTLYNDSVQSNSGSSVFANTPKGFKALLKWCETVLSFDSKTFTMEFTGRYSEKLMHFLFEQNRTVYMVSPFKSNRFRESYDADLKTDRSDAYTLALMGLERKLDTWMPDSEFFANLKIIVRERYGLVKQKTALKNKLHALDYANAVTTQTVKRLKEQLKLIRRQIRDIDAQIEAYLKSNPEVAAKVENLQTIPGVGLTTIATVLSETDGFAKTPNAKKLAAFAGYRVTVKESGTYKGQGHISKRGNSFIRGALHMPALCMIQVNPVLKAQYLALKARKAKPIIATTAIERKALIMMYSMYKNNTRFDQTYQKKSENVT